MKKVNFNFATVFSLMALLVYGYFAFMGLVYWKNGAVTVPVLFTLGGMLIALFCLFVMCMGKGSRWHIGKVGEIVFGVIILCLFVAAAIPFTNFFKVVENQGRIKGKVEQFLISSKNLDQAYEKYAEDRIAEYESQLKLVAEGKSIRPAEYDTLLAGAAGADDNIKIQNLTKSLRRQLLPKERESICKQRTAALEKASQMSVWNVLLPSNINKIATEVGSYVQNYTDLSSKIRKGETAEPFTYPEIKNDLNEIQTIYTHLSTPSFISILLSLICFLIMLLPYFITERSLAGRVSKPSGKVEVDYE